jgi:hypothetical protein
MFCSYFKLGIFGVLVAWLVMVLVHVCWLRLGGSAVRLVGDRSVQARSVLTFVPRECPVLSARDRIAQTFVTWSEPANKCPPF